jgi:regulator of sigma D
MIIKLDYKSNEYKDLRSQIFKLMEEVKEVEHAYLDFKYSNGIITDVGLELYDIIQTCATLLENQFSCDEIQLIQSIHNNKIKRRLKV